MDEIKIKNLEIIQTIINRMATNSFLIKGWTITIISGVISLNHDKVDLAIYLLIYSTIMLFWFLDSYYLQLERKYRVLYNNCLKKDIDFDLHVPSSEIRDKTFYTQVLLSKTESGFYMLLAFMISMVFLAL